MTEPIQVPPPTPTSTGSSSWRRSILTFFFVTFFAGAYIYIWSQKTEPPVAIDSLATLDQAKRYFSAGWLAELINPRLKREKRQHLERTAFDLLKQKVTAFTQELSAPSSPTLEEMQDPSSTFRQLEQFQQELREWQKISLSSSKSKPHPLEYQLNALRFLNQEFAHWISKIKTYEKPESDAHNSLSALRLCLELKTSSDLAHSELQNAHFSPELKGLHGAMSRYQFKWYARWLGELLTLYSQVSSLNLQKERDPHRGQIQSLLTLKQLISSLSPELSAIYTLKINGILRKSWELLWQNFQGQAQYAQLRDFTLFIRGLHKDSSASPSQWMSGSTQLPRTVLNSLKSELNRIHVSYFARDLLLSSQDQSRAEWFRDLIDERVKADVQIEVKASVIKRALIQILEQDSKVADEVTLLQQRVENLSQSLLPHQSFWRRRVDQLLSLFRDRSHRIQGEIECPSSNPQLPRTWSDFPLDSLDPFLTIRHPDSAKSDSLTAPVEIEWNLHSTFRWSVDAWDADSISDPDLLFHGDPISPLTLLQGAFKSSLGCRWRVYLPEHPHISSWLQAPEITL